MKLSILLLKKGAFKHHWNATIKLGQIEHSIFCSGPQLTAWFEVNRMYFFMYVSKTLLKTEFIKPIKQLQGSYMASYAIFDNFGSDIYDMYLRYALYTKDLPQSCLKYT